MGLVMEGPVLEELPDKLLNWEEHEVRPLQAHHLPLMIPTHSYHDFADQMLLCDRVHAMTIWSQTEKMHLDNSASLVCHDRAVRLQDVRHWGDLEVGPCRSDHLVPRLHRCQFLVGEGNVVC